MKEDRALAVLQASIPIGMSRVFDKKPLFIVGDCYVFGFMYDKTIAPVEGYYVNGMTGHVEYRKSVLQLRQVGFRATSISKACYSSVIAIGTDSTPSTPK